MFNELVTEHRPKSHTAISLSGKVLVESQTTEVGLVRELQRLGISLDKYDYFNNVGDEVFLTINWRKSLMDLELYKDLAETCKEYILMMELGEGKPVLPVWVKAVEDKVDDIRKSIRAIRCEESGSD